jgi:transcriptional regulator with XRE-family HTH domain
METQAPSDLDSRIAARVRGRRQALDLTLEDLAERSSVSRAMISRIERGEASPTAVLLAKLSNALGVTLSTLFSDDLEAGSVVRAASRPVWRDPATGYLRRNVSPLDAPVDIVDVTLPPGAVVNHDNGVPLNLAQLVWVLEGRLIMGIDGAEQDLGPGDCMQMRLDRPISFQNRTPAKTRYAVILSRSAR